MKFDVALWVDNLIEVPTIARAAEKVGFNALWTSDTNHNPIMPLVLAAEHTRQVMLGTAILVAFARSPMDVAYQAWDLAQFSRGRFLLGLGTQVPAHIRRRFSMAWMQPSVDALRDYIGALRAIWQAWQRGERLNYRGRFYTHTLMSPFFNPGSHDYPDIPIYTAGVNRRMCQLAGEVSNGFHVHPFHTRRYLEELVQPAIATGAELAGRELSEIEMSSAILIASGESQVEIDNMAQAMRQQIAFYASTPSYAAVMSLHGWDEERQALSKLASRQSWSEMPALISDEMLEAFAIICPWDELAQQIRTKYDGLLDRVTLYLPFDPRQDQQRWSGLCKALQHDPE